MKTFHPVAEASSRIRSRLDWATRATKLEYPSFCVVCLQFNADAYRLTSNVLDVAPTPEVTVCLPPGAVFYLHYTLELGGYLN